MKYIHISAKVERRLESLHKSGKAGNALAQKAVNIIEQIKSGLIGPFSDAVGSYTKYGEKRIKNCRKYDLGGGYRLITLQRGETLYIPLLGTHDECQRWLETNSRLKKMIAGEGTYVPIKRPRTAPVSTLDVTDQHITEDDEQLQLTDEDLRRVFRGLVEGARESKP